MINKKFLKKWVPQGVILIAQRLKTKLLYADWEYIPEGWNYASQEVKGWNLSSIADLQVEKWDSFCEHVNGAAPLFINHEASDYSQEDLVAHNTIMCFSYACALASSPGKQFRLLDWGGGIGHYGKIAEGILPGVYVKYTCYDLPVFCERGKKVYPEADFLDTIEEVCENEYDLTVISSSLWYDQYWQDTLAKLIRITNGYLFITRMVFVNDAPSYIVIQRPYSMGYKTEYLCQIFNKQEIVSFVEKRGFILIKEFFISDAQIIYNAPEQGKYRGFLFKKYHP